MHIDGVGSVSIPYTPAPIAPPTGSASFTAAQTAAAQALEEEEKKGGGGGGGGHGGARKTALDTIDEIAARASLNIEARAKTMLERMRDIERLKAELAAEDEDVGDKEPEERERDGREAPPEE